MPTKLRYFTGATALLCVLAFGPPYVTAENAAAQSMYKAGLRKYISSDFKGAITDFEDALQLDKENAKVRRMLVNALTKQGMAEYDAKKYDEAETYFLRALRHSGTQKQLLDLLTDVKTKLDKKLLRQTRPVITIGGQPVDGTPQGKTTKKLRRSKRAIEGVEARLRRNRSNMVRSLRDYIRQQEKTNDELLLALNAANEQVDDKLLALEKLQAERRESDNSRFFFIMFGLICLLLLVGVLFYLNTTRRRDRRVPGKLATRVQEPEETLAEVSEKLADSVVRLPDDDAAEVERISKLAVLYESISRDTLTWPLLQETVNDLSETVKLDVLKFIEDKLLSGEIKSKASTYPLLVPLITDETATVRSESQQLVRTLKGGTVTASAPVKTQSKKNTANANHAYLAKLIDSKTGREGHATRVSASAARIAKKMTGANLNQADVKTAGLLYDIGLLEISTDVLQFRGELSNRKFAPIKKHAEAGALLLEDMGAPQLAIDAARYHHENLNGSGYPAKIKNEKIPMIARIIAVADTYHALVADRPYRKALSKAKALDMIKKMAEKTLDGDVVTILVKIEE